MIWAEPCRMPTLREWSEGKNPPRGLKSGLGPQRSQGKKVLQEGGKVKELPYQLDLAQRRSVVMLSGES